MRASKAICYPRREVEKSKREDAALSAAKVDTFCGNACMQGRHFVGKNQYSLFIGSSYSGEGDLISQ